MKLLGREVDTSHEWNPDDDVIACDACGVRTYNDAAQDRCPQAPKRGTRIGIATPGGKYHIAVGTPPHAICDWRRNLSGQTEIREDVASMPRSALCLRCWTSDFPRQGGTK